MDKNRIWVIGAVLVSVVVLVGGWFLAIAPQLGAAADAAVQRAVVDQQNASYSERLRALQAAHAKLPETEKQLAELSKAIPSDAGLPAFYDELNAVAAANSVTITKVTPSDAVPYVPPVAPAASAPAPTSTPSPGATSAPAATPVPQPVATDVPGMPPVRDPQVTDKNLALIPLVVTVSGSEAAIQNFVQGLQSGDRLFLITGVSISSSPTGPSFQGRLSGYLFALAPASTLAVAAQK